MAVVPIQQWARYALTSDPNATAPSDSSLCLLVSEVEGQVQSLYPCLVAGGTTPEVLYDDDEPALNAYNRMVGYLVAARFLPGRSGQQYQATSVVVKVGPVTKTYGGPINVSTQVQDLSARAVEAARLVPCIAAALAAVASARGNLRFGLAGYRRERGGICTLEEALLGIGEVPF